MKQPRQVNQRVKDALAGIISPDDLTGEEQEVFFEEFADEMVRPPTLEERAAFLKCLGDGPHVGDDENGNLSLQQGNLIGTVYQTPSEQWSWVICQDGTDTARGVGYETEWEAYKHMKSEFEIVIPDGLRGSVKRYDVPVDPVGEGDWEQK